MMNNWKFVMVTFAVIVTFGLVAGGNFSSNESASLGKASGAKSVDGVESEIAVISFTGATCGSCEATITAALRALPGVSEIVVDARRGLAAVKYDGFIVDTDSMANAISESGYPAVFETHIASMPAADKGSSSAGCGGGGSGGCGSGGCG
jgi:copper chaperone